MSTILDRIKTYKLEEIAARKSARPLAGVEAAARRPPVPRGVVKALSGGARPGDGRV
ncbi:MAG: indole-3-glycerol-phosphate synthase TrpC, partial [Paracoccaceae bacterium]